MPIDSIRSIRRALARFIDAPPTTVAPAAESKSLLNGLLAMLHGGDLNLASLVASCDQHGLGDIVRSWIARGPNQAISRNQLRQVLGDQRIAQLAAETGLSPESTLAELTEMLPTIVDKLTPLGELTNSLTRQRLKALPRPPKA